MRVVIGTSPADGSCVDVVGEGVRGRALWRGDGAPRAGTYDVEVDVPGEVDWSDLLGARQPIGNELLVEGVVEDHDELGVLTVRLPGALVLVDTTGRPPASVVGRPVSFSVRGVGLHPTGA